MIVDKTCGATEWVRGDFNQRAEILVANGKVVETGESDRLSVSEDCSLVLKKVKGRDVGRYGCRQVTSGETERGFAHVFLSAVTSEYLHNVLKHYGLDICIGGL